VGPQERAILLRFGKPVGSGANALYGPGLHWSFPYPIDECRKVSITGLQKVSSSVGWFAITPEQEMAGAEPYAVASLNPAVDGYALTADGNIIHTRATLTYRIEDPVGFVFNFVNASNAVQNTLNNALIYTASFATFINYHTSLPFYDGYGYVMKTRDLAEKFRFQKVVFEAARMLFEDETAGWRGSKDFLLGQLISLVEQFLRSRRLSITPNLFAQSDLHRRVLLALSMSRIVQHVKSAVRESNTESRQLVLDENRPI